MMPRSAMLTGIINRRRSRYNNKPGQGSICKNLIAGVEKICNWEGRIQ